MDNDQEGAPVSTSRARYPLFELHGLPAPRLALHSQSALTLMVALANSDLLTMVPVQWTQFTAVSQSLAPIPVKEVFRTPSIVTVRRAGLPLTPAADFLLGLSGEMCRAGKRSAPSAESKRKSLNMPSCARSREREAVQANFPGTVVAASTIL